MAQRREVKGVPQRLAATKPGGTRGQRGQSPRQSRPAAAHPI